MFNTGVVNVVPVNNGVPPVAAAYQLIITLALLLLAVNVALEPGQTDTS